MKKILTALALSTAFSAQVFAEQHKHNKEHHQPAKKNETTKPVKRFVADENLKTRMYTILNTMKALHAGETKKSALDFKNAGTQLETTVADIFKNCKLDAEADAAIHPILASISEGAELLKKGKHEEGHEKIHHALLKYEDYFEHAGWNHHKDK